MRAAAQLILRTAILLWLASVAVFVLLRAIPGNPAEVALGVSATEADIAELTARLGLDRPLVTQYLDWVGALLRGDFGTSLTSGQDITPIVWDRGLVSLILCGAAMAASLLIAVPLGVAASRRGGRWILAVSQVGIAVPSFLAGILLVAVFAVRLGWLPANGWVPPGQGFGAFLSRLVLPVLALTAVQAAILTRYVRSAVAEVQSAEFMRTARAGGQSFWQAMAHHGLRNAAIPVLTVAGVQLSSLVVGAVVIERVFVVPGLGSLLLDSVTSRDLVTVQAVVMVLVVFTLVVNLVVDLAATAVDPRLRVSGGTK